MKKIIAAGMAGLTVMLASSLGQAQEPAAKPMPTGDVKIRVVLPQGAAFKRCTVYLGEKTATIAKGQTEALMTGIPVRRIAAFADASVGQGWFRSDARFVGAQEVFVKPGAVAEAVINLEKVEPSAGKSIDDYCRRCHPGRGEPIAQGQIMRDVHASGKPLKEVNISLVRTYNEGLEKLENEKKPHGYPMRTEEREVQEGGRKVKRIFFTCESCHTLHLTTAYGRYTVANFRTKSDLCRGCHD